MINRVIVFSDMDGTLLDHYTYSYQLSKPGIALLKEKGYPLVLVSSKTFPEMRILHRELALADPFVFENGGGIAWISETGDKNDYTVQLRGMDTSTLEEYVPLLRSIIGGDIVLLKDMPVEAVVRITGLPEDKAALALKRRTSLPFITGKELQLSQEDVENANSILAKENLMLTRGGRFYHFSSRNANKGDAVKEVAARMVVVLKDSKIKTAAIGDSMNDLPMLRVVDIPYLVRNQHGYDVQAGFPVTRTRDSGPAGFSEAVRKLCNTD
ncbi:MAG TPA: HAD-IIB family hydrolase [Spirochaetota bacterium]|nr:HAD-IIB family hydrolase [Spirochaetota bacterium]